MGKRKKIALFSLLLLLFFLGADFVSALEVNYPNLPDTEPPQQFLQRVSPEEALPLYIDYFFKLAIWILGFVAFGATVYGGTLYLTSTGEPEKLNKAREYLSSAFFGVLILLTSYLVLSIISPDLIKLEPPKIEEVKIEKEPEVPEPGLTAANTSIHVELPFGRLIEGDIFETYISDPKASPQKTPRLTRITNNASSTLDIASKISQNSQQLSSLAQECDCSQADPVCGWPPNCSPAGATPLSNILGPQGLLTYSNITGNLSDMLGAENLGSALGLSETISQGTGNMGELSSVLDSIDKISKDLSLSKNLPKALDIAGEMSSIARNPQELTGMVDSLENMSKIAELGDFKEAFDIATQAAMIAEDPTNLSGILASAENITDIIGATERAGDIYNIGYNIASIAENPNEYSLAVGSIANITNMLGASEGLSGVFRAAYDIASVADNPANIVPLLNSNKEIADVLESLGGSGSIEEVFDVGYNVALIAENPDQYSTMVGAASNIANIMGSPGDLGESFRVAYDIASIAEEPENLSRTFASLENINRTTGSPNYLRPAFKTVRDLGSIVKDPADLENVLLSSEQIARRVNSSEDIARAFEKAHEATGIVDDYQKYPELIGSMGRLSGIFENPAHLEQVLEIAKEKDLAGDPEKLVEALREDPDFRHVVPQEDLDKTLEEIENIAERTDSLDEVERITREMEKLVPDTGSLAEVLEKMENTSLLLEDPGDLRNISLVLEDFSYLSEDIEEAALLLEEFREISLIVHDLSDMENLENLAIELSYLAGDHYGFNEVLRNFRGVAAVIQEPEDIRNIQYAMEDLSRAVPELEGMSRVLEDFQGIGAIIQNPRDIGNIKIALTDLSKVFPEAKELSGFLGEYSGIASLVEDPADFQNIQRTADNLSEVLPQTGNLSEYFDNLQGIANYIQDPADFQGLQGALDDLSRILPEAKDLSDFLGEYENLAAAIKDPTDLKNIQGGLKDLSGVVPQAKELSDFLGEYAGIANVINDPLNTKNVMNAASDLAKIAPELSPVINELSSLGGLFGGPQGITGAFSAGSCTCDTCESVRGEIEKLQLDNTDNLFPSLREEQQKTIREKEDLKEEMDRLERAADFIGSCPYTLKESLSRFFPAKETYISQKSGVVRQFPFWDDIIIPYLTEEKETVSEWASFLCLIGGNILSVANPVEHMGEAAITGGAETCSNEVHVGDIIERTLRTADLMTQKMDQIIALDRELISETDKLHVLISNCTSQSPACYSVCIPIFDDGKLVDCNEWCEGSACPYGEIKEQAKKIQQILDRKNGLKYTINNPKPSSQKGMQKKTPKEEIGLKPIIDTIVPAILQDLETEVRHPMLACEPQQHEGNLMPCNRVVGKTTPEGLIQGCAREEEFFEPCIEECYLKETQEEYTSCLEDCLIIQREVYSSLEGSDEIPNYHHELNFYCCSAQIYGQ